MKNLFLGLIFLLATFSSTTEIKEAATAQEPICQFWIEVETDCGNDFALCIDDIPLDEIGETAVYFMEGRC